MSAKSRQLWADRLDRFCAVTGALLPVAIVSGNALLEAVLALVGLTWICRCLVARHNPLPHLLKQPQVLPWLAWYAVILLSLLYNGAAPRGWAHDFFFCRQLLYLLALLDIAQRQPVGRFLLYGLASGVLWAALNTAAAYCCGHDLAGRPLIRYTGKLKEAARIAGLNAYAAPFFLAWAVAGRQLTRRKRQIIAALGLIAALQLMQVHIRTALAAMVSGLLLSWAARGRRTWVSVVTTTVFLGIIAILILQRTPIEHLYSLYDRFHIWKVGVAMWAEHPLLGGSIAGFDENFSRTALNGLNFGVLSPDGAVFNGTEATHLHNQILMLLATTGALGLVAFIWLFYRSIRVIYQTPRVYGAALTVWPPAFLVIALLGWNIYGGWYQGLLVFWITFIGIASET